MRKKAPSFHLGDKVVLTADYHNLPAGRQGIVRTGPRVVIDSYGIEVIGPWESGHDLEGAINKNQGWWVKATHLELAQELTPLEKRVVAYCNRELGR